MNSQTFSGIEVLGDISWGTHFCQFYEKKNDLLEILVPYFKTGLENKEFCLWVVSDRDLISVEEAKAALEQAIPNLNQQLNGRNIEILDATEWYLEGNEFNLVRVLKAWGEKYKQTLARGYTGMRISGDTQWVSEKNSKDFYAYEKQLDDFVAGLRINVLCTYSLEKCRAADVLDVVDNHRFTIARRRGKWEMIETAVQIEAQTEIKRLDEARLKKRTPRSHFILGYGIASLSVIAAFIILYFIKAKLQDNSPYVSVFICAVIFSTWFGGTRPGLLAILLSTLAMGYYFLIPVDSFAFDPVHAMRLLLFMVPSFFIVWLSSAQRSISESLRHARDVLEETVQKLKQTNTTLYEEIVERKQAEEALRKNEDRIRLIINTIPTMAWTVQPDGIVDFVNQRWLDYSGLSLEENPLRIIHAEDLSR